MLAHYPFARKAATGNRSFLNAMKGAKVEERSFFRRRPSAEHQETRLVQVCNSPVPWLNSFHDTQKIMHCAFNYSSSSEPGRVKFPGNLQVAHRHRITACPPWHYRSCPPGASTCHPLCCPWGRTLHVSYRALTTNLPVAIDACEVHWSAGC